MSSSKVLRGPNNVEAVAIDEHFRHQKPGIVGARLHGTVGARRADIDEVTRLQSRQVTLEAQIVAGLADRPNHVHGHARRVIGLVHHRSDRVECVVERRAHEVVHRCVDDQEVAGVALLHIDHLATPGCRHCRRSAGPARTSP